MQLRTVMDLYNARALRERVMIAAAALVLLLALWDSLLMQPLRNTTHALDAEMSAYGSSLNAQTSDSSDPRQVAMTRIGELTLQSGNLDTQIATSARGFVPAQRMIEVLHDVLDQQQGLTLVSIRNLPVQPLMAAPDPALMPAGPYVHSIELIIEGHYPDIQNYVHQLEALPWKFRWSVLDLSTTNYPVNRVRLQLSTLSMEATWLGV